MPTAMPTAREPVTFSLGRNRIASNATKIGTDAFAIAAMPESMCFWPQAIIVNGIAALTAPRTSSGCQPALSWRNAVAP